MKSKSKVRWVLFWSYVSNHSSQGREGSLLSNWVTLLSMLCCSDLSVGSFWYSPQPTAARWRWSWPPWSASGGYPYFRSSVNISSTSFGKKCDWNATTCGPFPRAMCRCSETNTQKPQLFVNFAATLQQLCITYSCNFMHMDSGDPKGPIPCDYIDLW